MFEMSSVCFPRRQNLIGKRVMTTKIDGQRERSSSAMISKGMIRAVSHPNCTEKDLEVLIEFERVNGKFQQWMSLFNGLNKFFIEDKMVLAQKKPKTDFLPALSFLPLSNPKFISDHVIIEFLHDRNVSSQSISTLRDFQWQDLSLLDPAIKQMVYQWMDLHFGQILLMNKPSVAQGHQVNVYVREGERCQWNSALVLSGDDHTKLLELQFKNSCCTENAALVHITGLPVTDDSNLMQVALSIKETEFDVVPDPSVDPTSPMPPLVQESTVAATPPKQFFSSDEQNGASVPSQNSEASQKTNVLHYYCCSLPAVHDSVSPRANSSSPTNVTPKKKKNSSVSSDSRLKNSANLATKRSRSKQVDSLTFGKGRDSSTDSSDVPVSSLRTKPKKMRMQNPVLDNCSPERHERMKLSGSRIWQNLKNLSFSSKSRVALPCSPTVQSPGKSSLDNLTGADVVADYDVPTTLLQIPAVKLEPEEETDSTKIKIPSLETSGSHVTSHFDRVLYATRSADETKPFNAVKPGSPNQITDQSQVISSATKPSIQMNPYRIGKNPDAWLMEMKKFINWDVKDEVKTEPETVVTAREPKQKADISATSSRASAIDVASAYVKSFQANLADMSRKNSRVAVKKMPCSDTVGSAHAAIGKRKKLSSVKHLKRLNEHSETVRKDAKSMAVVARKKAIEQRKKDSKKHPPKRRHLVLMNGVEDTEGLDSVTSFLNKLTPEIDLSGKVKPVRRLLKCKSESKSKELSSPSPLSRNRNLKQSRVVKPAKSAARRDCEVKIQQFIDSNVECNESLSNILSKKLLNPLNASAQKVSFVQDDSCLRFSSVPVQCRECKSAVRRMQNNNNNNKILCRFFAFRKLGLSKKGLHFQHGFSSPCDADGADVSLWMPMTPMAAPDIDTDMAKYIINNVGNRFCELVEQEKEAISCSPVYSEVAWKRPVHGVREMCDVCNTTLFNVHWVCGKCGFGVCLDCYRAMKQKCSSCAADGSCTFCEHEDDRWPRCTSYSKSVHEPSRLMLTQIIPSDVLWVIGHLIHDIRKKWNLAVNCPCGEGRSGFDHQELTVKEEPEHQPLTDSGSTAMCSKERERKANTSGLKSIKAKKPVKAEASHSRTKPENVSSQLRFKNRILHQLSQVKSGSIEYKQEIQLTQTLDDVISRVGLSSRLCQPPLPPRSHHSHDSQEGDAIAKQESPGIYRQNLETTRLEFPDISHDWLDNGRLLRLLDPRNPANIRLFQHQWKRGQPVLVSNCEMYLNKELWLPESFSKEFGHLENDLVDCSRKVVLVGHKMRRFWDGFECIGARLKDKHGNPMILKLKDWPPTEDFSEMLPSRFEDLLQGLPLPEYTHRAGVFNLVSRLPDFFVRPDLGPKMYNAYGSALYPKVGSTNLHLDVSDAVNLILYVGIPRDDRERHKSAAVEAMREAGCCELTMNRILDGGEDPGALWHIFDPRDSDKIRDLLQKVAVEVGEPIEPNHDPIHDQSWYLDEKLRKRLFDEYSVEPYTLVQCAGDAIFIPAGAPHQVRNLHSCIKAAEDFVSPENLSYCFKLTQEFRHLSDTHSNHEDKLQVKNIIYHAVKDAMAVLMNTSP